MEPVRRLNFADESVSTVTSVNSSSVGLPPARYFSLLSKITDITPALQTFLAGTKEVDLLTFLAKANVTSKDYVVVTDTSGNTWAVYADLSGSDTAPSGAAYTAVNASRKVKADISGATTAAQVATIFKAAFDSLTGFTGLATLTDNTDGTLTLTHTARGPVTNPVPHNATDAGAGTIVAAESTPGVAVTIDLVTNIISKTAHGFVTGLKVRASSTGTLPAGLATATDYFVIKVDADTFKLATSYSNALAGTAIDITDYGTNAATHTITPSTLAGGTATPQGSPDGTNWGDIKSPEGASLARNVTGTGNLLWNIPFPGFDYVRVAYVLTAGYITAETMVMSKG